MMVKKTSNSSEKSFMSIKQGGQCFLQMLVFFRFTYLPYLSSFFLSDVKILELSWTTQTHSGFQQMISNNPNSIYFSGTVWFVH